MVPSVGAVAFGIAAVLLARFNGAAGHSLPPMPLQDRAFGPFYTGALLVIAIALVLYAARLKRPYKIAAMFLSVCVALSINQFRPDAVQAAYVENFPFAKAGEAVAWLRTQGPYSRDFQQVQMPEQFDGICEHRSAMVAVERGKTWFLFSVETVWIDNSIGFAWSDSGDPPPRTRYDIVRSTRLPNGWYMWWST